MLASDRPILAGLCGFVASVLCALQGGANQSERRHRRAADHTDSEPAATPFEVPRVLVPGYPQTIERRREPSRRVVRLNGDVAAMEPYRPAAMESYASDRWMPVRQGL